MASAPPTRYRRTASSITMANRWPGDWTIRLRLILARTASSTSSGAEWKPELAHQQRARVGRRLEETRDDRRAIDLELARALIQRPPGILSVTQGRARQPPPFDIHRVGRPGRRDEVGDFTLGAAYPA